MFTFSFLLFAAVSLYFDVVYGGGLYYLPAKVESL